MESSNETVLKSLYPKRPQFFIESFITVVNIGIHAFRANLNIPHDSEVVIKDRTTHINTQWIYLHIRHFNTVDI